MLRRTEDGKMVGATATAATEVTGRSIVIAGNLSFGAGIEGSYRPKGQFDSFDCASMMYVEMIEPEPGHAFATGLARRARAGCCVPRPVSPGHPWPASIP